MNFPRRLLRRFAMAVMRAAGIPVPGLPDWYFKWPLPADPLELDFPMAFKLVPDVYACVDLIQQTIAALPLRFYRGNEDSKVEIMRTSGRDRLGGRNVADLFATANPQDTGYELVEQLVGGLEIDGNAYMFLAGSGTSVDGLWMIPPQYCKPIPGPSRTVNGYEVKYAGAERVVVPPELVVHFKHYDPDGIGLGLSPLRVAQLDYETQHSAQKWQHDFFGRGGSVSGYFQSDVVLDVSNRERIQEDLEKLFAKRRNAVLLPKGLTPVRGGLTQQEMQFIETAGLTSGDIYRIFHVPPVLMGVKEGGGLSDAGATTDMLMFWQNCIQPRCRRIQTTINERLLLASRFPSETFCEFDFSQVLPFQQVFLDQAKAYVIATGRPVMTAQEGRERLGLEDLSDSTVDELVIPFNVQTTSEATAPDPTPNNDPNAVDAQPPAVVQESRAVSRDARRRRASAHLARFERRFARSMRGLFSRQEQRVVGVLRDVQFWSKQVHDPDAPELNGHVRAHSRVRITDLENLVTDHEADRALVRKLIRAIVEEAANAALAEAGLELAFDMSAREVAEFVNAKAARLIKLIDATTRRRLHDTLTDAIMGNEMLPEIVARVREVFNDRRANAVTIARTETAGAYNFAAEAAWDQSGVVEGKEWLTSHDEHVRESHVRAEELGAIPLGEPFRFIGEDGGMVEMQYPGDPAGPASDVINCRCTLIPSAVQVTSQPTDRQLPALTFDEFVRCDS